VSVLFRLVDIVAKLGETRKEGAGYIVWQEVFDNDVKVLCLSVLLTVTLVVRVLPPCVSIYSISYSPNQGGSHEHDYFFDN